MFKSRLKPAIESNAQGAQGALGRTRRAQRDRGSSLLLILTDGEDIEAICASVHTGQAKAVMQVVFDTRGGFPELGVVVTAITPSGWLAPEALVRRGEP